MRFAGLFWMQGESDSDTRAHAEAYGEDLTRFIAGIRAELHAPDLPVVIGQIIDIGLFDGNWRYSYIVREQERKVADSVHDAFLVSTAGLARAPHSPIHFSTRGTVDLGYRFVRRSFNL